MLCLIVPVIFTVLSLSGSTFESGQSFMLLMVLIAMPAGYLTLSMTRVLIYLPTYISMGSTRRVFYFSNIISSFISFTVCTEGSLLLTSALFYFIRRDAAVELGRLALSTQVLLPAICLSMLALGVGTLLGILMGRFGRKVFYIAAIVLVILGGACGGFSVAVFTENSLTLTFSNTVVAMLLGGAAVLGLALYGIAYPQIRKLNV
ncbi:hypothetical protein SAMN05192585_103109 [Acetanaerobacterium elongatum]|uniref:Uncharacterized protein n=2 Tax=Acetanaerobacterium elongatum TaxID=258515 RepID=A0A1G9VAA9_9FIRM|nr:hypothetical protein SAMN05192585_103109 [Acetanaerobacterium elongatum]